MPAAAVVGGGGAGICGRLIFGSKPRGDGGTLPPCVECAALTVGVGADVDNVNVVWLPLLAFAAVVWTAGGAVAVVASVAGIVTVLLAGVIFNVAVTIDASVVVG